jgi:crotonobetainyl-CoA:carnitine CoA-transferase CaiB-like acyl-CoA transferase
MLWKYSKTPLGYRRPAPCLGEHNEYVYKQIIGVSDEEYAALEGEGHIGLDYTPEVLSTFF